MDLEGEGFGAQKSVPKCLQDEMSVQLEERGEGGLFWSPWESARWSYQRPGYVCFGDLVVKESD
jgi:hypothetical protein